MKITTKYDIGQELWFMEKNKIRSGKVLKIYAEVEAGKEKGQYKISSRMIIENRDIHSTTPLFISKQELVASLIES